MTSSPGALGQDQSRPALWCGRSRPAAPEAAATDQHSDQERDHEGHERPHEQHRIGGEECGGSGPFLNRFAQRARLRDARRASPERQSFVRTRVAISVCCWRSASGGRPAGVVGQRLRLELYERGREAEKAGRMADAFLLYSQASAMDPRIRTIGFGPGGPQSRGPGSGGDAETRCRHRHPTEARSRPPTSRHAAGRLRRPRPLPPTELAADAERQKFRPARRRPQTVRGRGSRLRARVRCSMATTSPSRRSGSR